MLTRKLLSVIDNVVVDVLKIICCSESTDSFMVNITIAQQPGHSRGTRFYSRGPCPGCPPPLAPPLAGSHKCSALHYLSHLSHSPSWSRLSQFASFG